MYAGIKPITPTYLVQITNYCVYYVEASKCTVDGTFGTFNVNTLPCYTIGSNNWRKLHGLRMRRKKWLRK